jgi:hypothetical protein
MSAFGGKADIDRTSRNVRSDYIARHAHTRPAIKQRSLMSALGQKRTWRQVSAMSALTSTIGGRCARSGQTPRH